MTAKNNVEKMAKVNVIEMIENNPGIDFSRIWKVLKFHGYFMQEVVDALREIETDDNFVTTPSYKMHGETIPTTYMVNFNK